MVDPHRYSWRSIGNKCGTYKNVAQIGHMGEGPYQVQVGSSGDYDTTGVPGGPPDRRTDMDYHNNPPKGEGGMYVHFSGGVDM